MGPRQVSLFEQDSTGIGTAEFEYVPCVLESEYSDPIARLATEDGIAKRAARKNMQIHSAIVLKVDGAFAGFMTFQNNHEIGEFCLLQSVIEPAHYTQALYREMVCKVIEQNTSGYPAIITTDPKSKFETPALFESLGFETYLKMSGFHYMVRGDLADVRMKLLCHITMTNVWVTTKGDWLRLKREWNTKINEAGERQGVNNPTHATREGAWQGSNGYSNVVLTEYVIEDGKAKKKRGKSFNSNASVLDPVACELILRFCMPKNGRRVYNPFSGGVQFGFIAGSYGYDYIGSEIRQNQCDANNAICSGHDGVIWMQSDSSTFDPPGMFDLVFTCPPYYKVETYLDYDGKPPLGELNTLISYEEFRETLFKGYEKAIEHLNDGCFFVCMIGDSRDKRGGYHCAEAETELFLRDRGLLIYNRIVYVEPEFTRLAHAKKTLNYRKFPKREQKIIMAYKGDSKQIKELYPPVGRL